MKYLLLLLLFFIQLHAFNYILTSKELNESINKKFPMEKDVFISKAVFSNPLFKIDKKPIYEIKNASATMKIANSAVKNVIISDGAIKIIFLK